MCECLHVCIGTHVYLCLAAHRYQKGELDPLELEKQTVTSHHVGARTNVDLQQEQ